MRTWKPFIRTTLSLSILLLIFSCDEETAPTQSLPSGCQVQGVHAIAVLDSEITCIPTNAFQDTSEALGPPDGRSTGGGKLEFDGFVSLGTAGSITLFMGACIQDLPGPDLRAYQTVSTEALEILVSQDQNGPFTSVGTQACIGFCDFDLAGSGLSGVRFVKVVDQSRTQFFGAECDNVGPSPGADLDAVEVLH